MFLLIINIIIICLVAGLVHFLLNKFVDKFPLIYLKYYKTQQPSTLLIELIKVSKKPLIVLVWLFGCIYIIEVLISKKSYVIHSLKLFGLIICITWLMLRLLQQLEEYLINFVYKGENKDFRRHKTTIIAVWRLLKILLVIFAVLIVMQSFHVDVTGIVAIGSASTIVLGLAAKELLANFFGGMMILMDQQFMVGDSIKSPSQNIEGVVEYIGWRLTRIRTVDKSLLYVPNSIFLTIGVENTSRRHNYQLKEIIRLKYQDLQKINLIIDDILAILKNHPDIDNNQMCFVGLNKFNYMAADCLLWCFTKAVGLENHLQIQNDILQQINVIVTKHGVEIASSYLIANQ